MFENKLFGNYWHGGASLVNRASNPNPFQRADTTIVYRTTIPTQENLIWTHTTTGPTTLSCKGYLNNTIFSGKKIMNLVLKGKKMLTSREGEKKGVCKCDQGSGAFIL